MSSENTKEEEKTPSAFAPYVRPLAIVTIILALALLTYYVWTTWLRGSMMIHGGGKKTNWKGGCGCTTGAYN